MSNNRYVIQEPFSNSLQYVLIILLSCHREIKHIPKDEDDSADAKNGVENAEPHENYVKR